MPDFHRKPNRLAPESYRGRRSYFLTLCTGDRRALFTDATFLQDLLTVLRTTCASHSFSVYAYCFMPDHLHLILNGENDSSSLPRVVQAFKSLAAREARKIGIADLWQKGFYDHVLRGSSSIDAAAWYMFMNPVRAGLSRRAEEWPYSGSFVFSWPNVPIATRPFVPPWKTKMAS
jgi:putative transposase